jgi:hypothetical protein
MSPDGTIGVISLRCDGMSGLGVTADIAGGAGAGRVGRK